MVVAVCDDEKQIRDFLRENILGLYPDADVISFADAGALLACPEPIDILFLDIQMDGMSGIDAARELRKRDGDAAIIFVTAAEDYVYQAFDVRAFHYLVKPVEKQKLCEVLANAVRERGKKEAAEQKEKASITVKKGSVTRRIFLNEIMYLEVFNRKVTLHTAEEDIEFYGKLSEIQNCLTRQFVRCHRAYIVNLQYVKKYDAGGITLDSGARILLAKQKYPEFVKCYMQYANRLMEQEGQR